MEVFVVTIREVGSHFQPLAHTVTASIELAKTECQRIASQKHSGDTLKWNVITAEDASMNEMWPDNCWLAVTPRGIGFATQYWIQRINGIEFSTN